MRVERRGVLGSDRATGSRSDQPRRGRVSGQEDDPDDLLAAADAALYRAKDEGRNCVVIDDELDRGSV